MRDKDPKMRDMLQFYIDGEWVDPETPNPFDVINPATEEVCGRISLPIPGFISGVMIHLHLFIFGDCRY